MYENGNVVKWGFLVEPSDFNHSELRVNFKRFLSSDFLAEAQKILQETGGDYYVPWNHREVERLYRDYLTKMYSCLPREWEEQAVDYIFSVPTTWNEQEEIYQRFKTLFRDAGFGSRPKHRAFIGDSEAVAAAAQVLRLSKYHVSASPFIAK